MISTGLHKLWLFSKFAFTKKRPASIRTLWYDITNRCNLNCRHCDIDRVTREKDLSLEEIRKFILDLGHVDDVGIGGGEPFLREDLVEICELFVKIAGTNSISIHSNGFNTDSIISMVESILARCEDVNINIGLSLDGFESTHDSIRRPGSYQRVMEAGHRLVALKKKYPNLSLYFSATIHNLNYSELPDLSKFVSDEFDASLGFTIIDGTQQDRTIVEPELDQLEQTLDGLYFHRKKSKLYDCYLKVFREVRLRTQLEERQVIPCTAGRISCQIKSNGDIFICNRFPSLGNVRDKSFRDIWWGVEAKRQYDAISSGKCRCNDLCMLAPSLRNYWKLPFLMLRTALKNIFH